LADVRPFRGIRYNIHQLGDLSALICPPYDVVSPRDQLCYHHRSPYNAIRLELGEDLPGDTPEDNRYTRAAHTLQSWLKDGILVRDETPAFYLIEHRFEHQDGLRSRFSLLARVRLEDFSSGHIRPHEMTIGRAGADRLRLLNACNANVSPIMALFRHSGTSVLSLLPDTIDPPIASAADRDGVGYAMWVIADQEVTASISESLADKELYIADGHHRYETALAYQRQQRSAQPSRTADAGFDFVMMTLSNANDSNLFMEPTHRIVRGLDSDTLSQLEKGLGDHFRAEVLSPMPDASDTLRYWLDTLRERGQQQTTFGLYGLDGDGLRLLSLTQKGPPAGKPGPTDDLDVQILHRLILNQTVGMSSADMAERCLDYTRDESAALSRVQSGEDQLAFFLNPTPISSVLDVADQGARMPQKSTYFRPKTATGLVINPLWDD
jgi:uncharacterized protein (DUF1015 family)